MSNTLVLILFIAAFVGEFVLMHRDAKRLKERLRTRFGLGRLADPDFSLRLETAFHAASWKADSSLTRLGSKLAILIGLFVGLVIYGWFVPAEARPRGSPLHTLEMFVGLASALAAGWLVHMLEMKLLEREFLRVLAAEGIAPDPGST